MAEPTERELWYNPDPKCPYCGEIFDISDNEAWHLYSSDESKNEIECPECEKKYHVQTTVTYKFSTDKEDIF